MICCLSTTGSGTHSTAKDSMTAVLCLPALVMAILQGGEHYDLTHYFTYIASGVRTGKHAKDLNMCCEWSKIWEMECNGKEWCVLEKGRSERRPNWPYKMGKKILEEKGNSHNY